MTFKIMLTSMVVFMVTSILASVYKEKGWDSLLLGAVIVILWFAGVGTFLVTALMFIWSLPS